MPRNRLNSTSYMKWQRRMNPNDYEISNLATRAERQEGQSGRWGARRTSELRGKFMTKHDRNIILSTARQTAKDRSLRGNDYKYGTREEVQAQHNARYRDLRRAFGMSAG